MQAQEIMEAITHSLAPDMTLEDAVCEMQQCTRGHGGSVKGMVVVNSDKKLVGILSIKDIMRAMVPSYLKDGVIDGLTWEGMLVSQAKKVRLQLVQDVMNDTVITVSPTANLMVVTNMMIDHKLQRLPVQDKSGAIIGMVYVRDIYSIISAALCGNKS